MTRFEFELIQELQQHDVQELNRILFCAIESSLLGTSGERLIATLYHGTSVQQVRGSKATDYIARGQRSLLTLQGAKDIARDKVIVDTAFGMGGVIDS